MKYYQRDYFQFTCKLDEHFSLENYLIETPTYRKLTLPVTDGKIKRYVTLIDFGKKDKIYYRNPHNKSVSVDWNERQNVNLSNVHFSQIYSIEAKEYLTSYDCLNALVGLLSTNYERVANSTLFVSGEITRNKTPNGIYPSYNIKRIKFHESNKLPLGFKREVSVLIKPNSLTMYDTQFEFDGYTKAKRDNQIIYTPERFVIPFNDENDKVKVLYKQLFNHEKVISVLLDVRFAKERIIEEMTPEQQVFINLGLMTKQEVIEENTHSGNGIQNNVVKPLLKGQYDKLIIAHDEKDLQDMIFED